MPEPIVRVCARIVSRESAFPFAVFVAKGWIWLYTSLAPEQERIGRRAELLSDLHEHIRDSRADGVGTAAIAFQILFRMLLGAPDDLAWSSPYLPAVLAKRLMGWSWAKRLSKTPICRIRVQALRSEAQRLMKRAQYGIHNTKLSLLGGNMILKALAALLIVMGIAAAVAGGGLTLGGYLLIQRSAEMFGMFILMIGLGGLVMGGRFVIEGGRQLR